MTRTHATTSSGTGSGTGSAPSSSAGHSSSLVGLGAEALSDASGPSTSTTTGTGAGSAGMIASSSTTSQPRNTTVRLAAGAMDVPSALSSAPADIPGLGRVASAAALSLHTQQASPPSAGGSLKSQSKKGGLFAAMSGPVGPASGWMASAVTGAAAAASTADHGHVTLSGAHSATSLPGAVEGGLAAGRPSSETVAVGATTQPGHDDDVLLPPSDDRDATAVARRVRQVVYRGRRVSCSLSQSLDSAAAERFAEEQQQSLGHHHPFDTSMLAATSMVVPGSEAMPMGGLGVHGHGSFLCTGTNGSSGRATSSERSAAGAGNAAAAPPDGGSSLPPLVSPGSRSRHHQRATPPHSGPDSPDSHYGSFDDLYGPSGIDDAAAAADHDSRHHDSSLAAGTSPPTSSTGSARRPRGSAASLQMRLPPIAEGQDRLRGHLSSDAATTTAERSGTFNSEPSERSRSNSRASDGAAGTVGAAEAAAAAEARSPAATTGTVTVGAASRAGALSIAIAAPNGMPAGVPNPQVAAAARISSSTRTSGSHSVGARSVSPVPSTASIGRTPDPLPATPSPTPVGPHTGPTPSSASAKIGDGHPDRDDAMTVPTGSSIATAQSGPLGSLAPARRQSTSPPPSPIMAARGESLPMPAGGSTSSAPSTPAAVTMPRAARSTIGSTSGSGAPGPPTLAEKTAYLRSLRLHVLVVDDSDLNRAMITRLFVSALGATCEGAENGAIAVSKVESSRSTEAIHAAAGRHSNAALARFDVITMDKTVSPWALAQSAVTIMPLVELSA